MRNLKKTVARLKTTIRRIERKQDRILAELLLIKCKSIQKIDETDKLLLRLRNISLSMERDSQLERELILKSEFKPDSNGR